MDSWNAQVCDKCGTAFATIEQLKRHACQENEVFKSLFLIFSLK